ncbi:MAG TPA: hypothetical protein VIF37_20545 [Methylobacter sp.]|jgi:hypothetical protein
MAKTIIIIEDTDTKTESFEVKVLKFQTPEELAVADTTAIAVGDQLAEALAHSVQKIQRMRSNTLIPMQSASHH